MRRRTPADFAREAWRIVEASADSARYSGPTLESLFAAAMAQGRSERARSPLRDAVLLTIGRLRGAAGDETSAASLRVESIRVTALREWADQLERALEQEGRG